MASVRPLETVNKALLSTTSSFIGEYEGDGVLVGHAWPGFRDAAASSRRHDGPASRAAFVFVFETPPIERAVGITLPDYSGMPELLTWYLSVLFGKRFDNHGLIETIGHFSLPNLDQFSVLCRHTLPHNSRNLRADYPIPLNLGELARIKQLLAEPGPPEAFLRIFQTACKFYCQAIQTVEKDPEVAYLHLVTSVEILSSLPNSTNDTLLDPTTTQYLERIEGELRDGMKVARHFRSKLLSIKRRFVNKILELVDDAFFTRSECQQQFGRLRQENFRKLCGAAYDLRSQYVHTGVPFGSWVSSSMAGTNSEIQVGRPVVSSKSYATALANAPTFVGLERIVRFCLLKSAEKQGAYVNPPHEDA